MIYFTKSEIISMFLGLDLHFWRKTCKNCKCKKENHDIQDDDVHSWAEFELLGSRPVKDKTLRLSGRNVKLDWAPKGDQELVDKYLQDLPPELLPIQGSVAATERKILLRKQVPFHDIDPSLCHQLTDDEIKKMNDYILQVKEKSAGVGRLLQIKFDRATIKSDRVSSMLPNSQIVQLQSSSCTQTIKPNQTNKLHPANKSNQINKTNQLNTLPNYAATILNRNEENLYPESNLNSNQLKNVGVMYGRRLDEENNVANYEDEEVTPFESSDIHPEEDDIKVQSINKKQLKYCTSINLDPLQNCDEMERLKLQNNLPNYLQTNLNLEDVELNPTLQKRNVKNKEALMSATTIPKTTITPKTGTTAVTQPNVTSLSQITKVPNTTSMPMTASTMMPINDGLPHTGKFLQTDNNTHIPNEWIQGTIPKGLLPTVAASSVYVADDNLEPMHINVGTINDINYDTNRQKRPSYLSEYVNEPNPFNNQKIDVCGKIPECHRCHKMFDENEMAIGADRTTSLWHTNCFKCAGCNQSLADLLYFYDRETDDVYCLRDYAKIRGIPRCNACDELIFVKEYCLTMENTFHLKHFCCYECDIPLAGHNYVLDDDKQQPICLPCYESLQANKCNTCKNVIKPDEQGASLMDIHFHANNECFSCKTCSKPLLGNKFLFRNQNLYCSGECYSADR